VSGSLAAIDGGDEQGDHFAAHVHPVLDDFRFSISNF